MVMMMMVVVAWDQTYRHEKRELFWEVISRDCKKLVANVIFTGSFTPQRTLLD